MASPAAASDLENNEEQNEPPPPGGETIEEARPFTPMDDEKSVEEKKPSPQVKQAPTSVQHLKNSAPAVNNLAMLAQKAPLLALQQAILGGNPLGLLGELKNTRISILLIALRSYKIKLLIYY